METLTDTVALALCRTWWQARKENPQALPPFKAMAQAAIETLTNQEREVLVLKAAQTINRIWHTADPNDPTLAMQMGRAVVGAILPSTNTPGQSWADHGNVCPVCGCPSNQEDGHA